MVLISLKNKVMSVIHQMSIARSLRPASITARMITQKILQRISKKTYQIMITYLKLIVQDSLISNGVYLLKNKNRKEG